MNCDQVFDILTRGPFPAGHSSDSAVERHLTICHPCRRLAEALRPAVDLFHESVEAEEGRELPGYHGVLCAPAVEHLPTVVQQAITQPLSFSAEPTAWWLRWFSASSNLWRFSAAALLGAALCVVMWSMITTKRDIAARNDSLGNMVSATPTLAGYLPDGIGKQLLVSLHLPKRCLEQKERVADVSKDQAPMEDLHCCTECHSMARTDRPTLQAKSITTLNRSCNACHQQR